MVTFDEVLPRLVAACESEPGFAEVVKAVAVRDLVGRVRLAIKTNQESAQEAATRLSEVLEAKLSGSSVSGSLVLSSGPVRSANGPTFAARSWTWGPHGESRLSKIAWITEEPAKPPWSCSMNISTSD